MIRLADYVIKTLADFNITQAFLVTGGAAMHLNDAVACEERMQILCHHHEQAAAYAAEGYGHLSGKPALVLVTAGPGAINAMSGVFGAFVDSIPMIVISGQSKNELIRCTYGFEDMRQLGEQEADVISMVRSITKYARRVTTPDRIVFELHKALHLATEGRPGPVWLEIPTDVQASVIEPSELATFLSCRSSFRMSDEDVNHIIGQLETAKRPLVVVGPDIPPMLHQKTRDLLERLGCPVVGAGVEDVILNDHPLFAGRMGILGTRAGNIAVQNADVILFLGMRPYLGLVTYDWKNMGRNAHKIVIDEDPNEFEKPCSIADEAYCFELKNCLEPFMEAATHINCERLQEWRTWCVKCQHKLPLVMESMQVCGIQERINPYWFAANLVERLDDNDCVVASNASSSVIPLQAGKFHGNMRIFSNHGNGAMGFSLPASLGASMASPLRRIICLEGDGSIMMNIQELQTVVHHQLPIIIFIFNNDGYFSIQQTQKNFFGRVIGAGPQSGVSFPDFLHLANGFGLKSCRLSGDSFTKDLEEILKNSGPLLVDVMLDSSQPFTPKVSSRRLSDGTMISSLPEDMSPFLEKDELSGYMIGRSIL